ncbi:MAG: flp pilus-assembly TadE/G-like family protein [Sporichthyaceae bacterium]|nr:flp pilus-assembly TadE/G-like family protein [Sporichthyaceae bacterium]
MTAARPAGGTDRGSATIFGLIAVVLVTLVGMAGVLLGYAVVGRHRAAAAADLAALAGAARAVDGSAPACAVVGEVASANGASISNCRLDGLAVEVVTEVRLPPLFGVPVVARSRARAGPG